MKLLIAKILSSVLRAYFKLRFGGRISWGRDVILNHRFKFKGPGKLIIGDEVNMWAHKEANEFLTFSNEAVIKIGKRTRLNGVTVQCRQSVTIGEECLIGSAIIMDNDFHSVYFEKRKDPKAIKSAPVVIGDCVWLAGQCAILKGVNIGTESVVGFRAVVTKDIPAKKVAAGNPAVIVKDIC
ncbi:MAG: acyltransferase [Patescibacteria group bacterium]